MKKIMADEFKGKIVRFAWDNAWRYRSGMVHFYDIDSGNVIIKTFDMKLIDVPEDHVLGFMRDGVFISVEIKRAQRS